MILEIKEFKKVKEQILNLEPGINLLVGANGSGKSSLLEYLFGNESVGFNRIAYSSGINQSYSSIYTPILEKKIRKHRSTYFSFGKTKKIEIDEKFCIYLDKKWAPFLIVSSLLLKKEKSLCSSWMSKLGLKVFNLSYPLYFNHSYRKRIKLSIDLAISGESYLGIQNTTMHRFISKLCGGKEDVGLNPVEEISIGTLDDYDNGSGASKEIIEYFFKNNIFADANLFASADPKKIKTEKQSELQLIHFFSLLQALTSGLRPILDLNKTELSFANNANQKFKLSDLSDGEYQLLTTSALIDLFGSEDSILLLDEIDAHIHPNIIRDIWQMLEPLKQTTIITSSHNMMSLSLTDINKIRFMEDGTIQSDSRKKDGVISSLCGAYFSMPVAQSLYYSCKNLFLVDGDNDWDFFKALFQLSGKNIHELENNSMIIPIGSTTQKETGFEEALQNKITWIENFKKSLLNLNLDANQIRLQNFILICDKDALDLTKVKPTNGLYYKEIKDGISKVSGFRGEVHQFILNRRNIESYFISEDARKFFAAQVTEKMVIDKWKISMDEFTKSRTRYLNSYVGAQIRGLGPLFVDSEMYNKRSIEEVDAKKVIQAFVSDDSGVNLELLNNYISKMALKDIDPYLAQMFDKIKLIVTS